MKRKSMILLCVILGAAAVGIYGVTQLVPLPTSPITSVPLTTKYFQLQVANGQINTLQVDPAGQGNFAGAKNIVQGSFSAYAKRGDGVFFGHNSSLVLNSAGNVLSWNITFDMIPNTTAVAATFNISFIQDTIQVVTTFQSPNANALDVDSFGIGLEVPFVKAGFDTNIASTVFARFFANNFDYLPIEQFKRRDTMPLFSNSYAWVVAGGVEGLGYDLNFTNFGGRLGFKIDSTHLTLLFETGDVIRNAPGGTLFTRTLDIKVQAPSPLVPSQYPYFYSSNASFSNLLNSFMLERVFSMPPNSGQADWLEWENTIVDWMDSPYLSLMKAQLLAINLEPDGYVYSWGDAVGWPFPDNSLYNTRHYTTNANFILGTYRYFSWTKDTSFLLAIYPRLRAAMQYYLVHLNGSAGLLVNTDINHEGRGLAANGSWQSVGSNYWDILPFGYKDAYANAYFQGSLRAMAEIESFLGNTSESLSYSILADLNKAKYNEVFWNGTRQRYIGCIDADGVVHDYGFVFLNLEAIYYGLANTTQVFQIYDWLENEPTSSGAKDTFTAYGFAPRATTDENTNWWFARVNQNFGEQVQDGGAILYTEGYDLRDRALYFGPDNAFDRLTAVLARYALPDKLCGGGPRYTSETPQQENAGGVGTDYPFPESGLAPVSALEAIFGIRANTTNLIFTPELPASLSYAGVHGVQVANVTMDINVTETNCTITWLKGQPAYNFTIACGNVSFMASDLLGNGTISFANPILAQNAATRVQLANATIMNAISGGTVFSVNGTNQVNALLNLYTQTVTENLAGNFATASAIALAIVNATSYLVSTDELGEIITANATLDTIISQLTVQVLYSPQAVALRAAALQETQYAKESLARGDANWFYVHMDRCQQIIDQMEAVESKQVPTYLFATIILPLLWVLTALVSFPKMRRRRRVPQEPSVEDALDDPR